MKKTIVFLAVIVCLLTLMSCETSSMPKCKDPIIHLYKNGRRPYVTIGTQTYGAEIAYTIENNGNIPFDPDSASSIFKGHFFIYEPGPVTIKAQAFKEGYKNSRVVVKKITF